VLIKFFKSSFYLQYFMLLLIGAGLWVKAYTSPCELSLSDEGSPLYVLLYGLLPGNHAIIGLGILIFEALLLNFILIRHEIVPKNTLLSALVFIVFMSQSPIALSLNPVLMAGLFIIPAFDRILNAYGMADPTKDVFSASFLIGLASLFYFPFVFVYLLLLFSFIIFGTFSIRMRVISIFCGSWRLNKFKNWSSESMASV